MKVTIHDDERNQDFCFKHLPREKWIAINGNILIEVRDADEAWSLGCKYYAFINM